MRRHSARRGVEPWKCRPNKTIKTGSEDHSVTNSIRYPINTGNFAGALDLILKIEDLGKRDNFLVELKNACCNAGKFQFAIDVTARIKNDEKRSKQFGDIFTRLWRKRSYKSTFILMFHLISHISYKPKVSYLNQIVDNCKHGSCLDEAEKEEIEEKALNMLKDMGEKYIPPKKHR